MSRTSFRVVTALLLLTFLAGCKPSPATVASLPPALSTMTILPVATRTAAVEATELVPSAPAAMPLAVPGPNAGELIIRAGPGTEFPPINQLVMGEAAPIVGKTPEGDWWQVEIRGMRGWIYAPLVDVVGPVSLVPVVPTPTVFP